MSPFILAALVASFGTSTYDGNLIEVEAAGFSTEGERVVVAVFDRGSWDAGGGVPGADLLQVCAVRDSSISAGLTGLPHGQFVILVFSDPNANSNPDWGEEIGLSNNPALCGVVPPQPAFDDLAIMNKAPSTRIEIVVRGCGS